MDTTRVKGTYAAQYGTCDQTLQGLTVGCGGTHGERSPEQWIDLGASRLAVGTYAVQSTAKPKNKLDEGGRDGNNIALTCFTVGNGNTIRAIAR